MPPIHTIDLNFRGVSHAIAAYAVETAAGLALIETGPASCLPALTAGLKTLGFRPSDVKHVLLTHIHFDHAGAAGWWAAQGAHVYVHHAGAPHMIDPSRLNASAKRVYGDEMETLWGTLLPIDPTQVTILYDGDEIRLGEQVFECLDTPGHARHHMAFKLADICFTGDVGGVRLAGRPMIDLPSAPPQFDPDAWLKSVKRLAQYQFKNIYPTHFGGIFGAYQVESHLAELTAFIPTVCNMIKANLQAGQSRDEIVEIYTDWQRARGREARLTDTDLRAYFTATPPDVAVDGIIRYWKKRWENESMGHTD